MIVAMHNGEGEGDAMIVGFIFVILGLFSIGSCGVWHVWWYPSQYEYALRLADDASLPDAKAEYLQEYLNRVKTISGPPRYIFTRPDLDLDKQRIILAGLITRFKDIAKLDPKELGYQQGMMQLTGQEIDHQLKRISSVFVSAKLRESPFLFILFGWISWLSLTSGLIYLAIWWDNY